MATTSQSIYSPASPLRELAAQFLANPSPRFWNVGSLFERVRQLEPSDLAAEIKGAIDVGLVTTPVDWSGTQIQEIDPHVKAWLNAMEVITDEMLRRGNPSEITARIHAAGILYAASINALWQKVDATSEQQINDFLSKLESLKNPVLASYGVDAKELLDKLVWIANLNARNLHSLTSPASEPSTKGTAKNGWPLISKPSVVIDGFASCYFYTRQCADLNVTYARRKGRDPNSAANQEALLADAREWTRGLLRELLPEANGLVDLEERAQRRTWDEFVLKHRHNKDCDLSYADFCAALWCEGWPSLRDIAIELLQAQSARQPLFELGHLTAPSTLDREYGVSAKAKAVRERTWASVYQTFYRELQEVGKLTPVQAVSHMPFDDTLARMGCGLASFSQPAAMAPLEDILFRLAKSLILADKQMMEDSDFPPSVAVSRLETFAARIFHEVYHTKIREFAERAGFYAEKSIPEAVLRLLPLNARAKIVDLVQEQEAHILAKAATLASLKEPAEPPAEEARRHGEGSRSTERQKQHQRKGRPVRRSPTHSSICVALERIAESRPQTQEEVFRALEERHVVPPQAKPFATAKGWLRGFQQNPPAARAWLSQWWAELDLPRLPRGPKPPQK